MLLYSTSHHAMKTIIFTLFFCTSLLFLPLSAQQDQSAQKDSSPKPVMKEVFEKPRPEQHDVIHFRNNDVLRGHVVNEKINIQTQYGLLNIPVRKLAGISFEGARNNTEALVTVNFNRYTGIIPDKVIEFKIASSNTVIKIRKEKIRFVLFQKKASELDFLGDQSDTTLFVMANGDIITGKPRESSIAISTDYADVPLKFSEIKDIEMQGGHNVTAVIKKQNKDVMRGKVAIEELTVEADLGVNIEAIYIDKFAKIKTKAGYPDILPAWDMAVPEADTGESEGASSYPPEGANAGKDIEVVLGGVHKIKLKWIPAGEFVMGSPSSEGNRDNDEFQHKVTLTKGFWIGETEITQNQWQALMGSNPSRFEGGLNPVEDVSWSDAVSFCSQLNDIEKQGGRVPDGYVYSLPTEAQWEYACRAGTTGAYAGVLGQMAWYGSNSGGKTHRVATKEPNKWGLYDMHGNVYEWCYDWYGDYDAKNATDPIGPSSGSDRVRRGGSWRYGAQNCRSANRYPYKPGHSLSYLGFRLALRPVR